MLILCQRIASYYLKIFLFENYLCEDLHAVLMVLKSGLVPGSSSRQDITMLYSIAEQISLVNAGRNGGFSPAATL